MPSIPLIHAVFRNVVFALCLAVSNQSGAHDGPEFTRSIDSIRFAVADGMTLERVAGNDLIRWPIVADFDRDGHLIVAESGGVASPIAEHNEKGVHKIVRLIDDDRDGTYDRRQVVADGLAFPQGVLCFGDSIYVGVPPRILKLTDADGDGVCEQRTTWFDGGSLTDCANDVHGPYLGRDGWLYWTKGGFGKQTHPLADGRVMTSDASHIYRRRPDASPLAPLDLLIAGGMDNPVDVAMTISGEQFFTSTFLKHPGGGTRDGIAHAVYGGLFGKRHSVIEGQIRTGELMPVMTHLGPAAPSGLMTMETPSALPAAIAGPGGVKDVLVAALFNRSRVTAHRLIPAGATYRTEDHDLLIADRIDFHPTDVLEDADGSILVIDTGGWYDLCCPTSRIDQKTAGGGIYRLELAHAGQSTTGKRTDAPEIAAIDDSRPWIRREAKRRLAGQGGAIIDPLSDVLLDPTEPTTRRLRALWTLVSLDRDDAMATIMKTLDDPDASLVRAAAQAVSLRRARDAKDALHRLLGSPDASTIRVAAEGLGRMGDQDSIRPLLIAFESAEDDRFLRHSILYALIECLRPAREVDPIEIATGPAQTEAALIALSQIDQGYRMYPSDLWKATSSNDRDLRETAFEILASTPRWAHASTDALAKLWNDPNRGKKGLETILTGWRFEAAITDFLADRIDEASELATAKQDWLADRIDRFAPIRVPPSWAEPLAKWLATSAPDTRSRIAAALTRTEVVDSPSASLANTLVELASASGDPARRLSLLAALPPQADPPDGTLQRLVIDSFVDDELDRSVTTAAIGRVAFSPLAIDHLIDSIDSFDGNRLPVAIDVVARRGTADAARLLLKKLPTLPIAKTLPQGHLARTFHSASDEIVQLAAEVDATLARPPDDIATTVAERLGMLSEGDPVAGLKVFRGTKAQCGACHRMGYLGGELGPDLTEIGGSRTPEALLEAILFPSARLEQSYRSTRVLTVDGQLHNGLVRHRDAQSIQLQTAADRRLTIATEEIELESPSDVSVMPNGLADQLTVKELSDLMALLRAAK